MDEEEHKAERLETSRFSHIRVSEKHFWFLCSVFIFLASDKNLISKSLIENKLPKQYFNDAVSYQDIKFVFFPRALINFIKLSGGI